jgi:hypothetical protein
MRLRRAGADGYEKAMTKSYSPNMPNWDSVRLGTGDGAVGSYLKLISVSSFPICLSSDNQYE